MSWKPQVMVEGKWSSNQLVFATKEEASRYAHDLFIRWTMSEAHQAVESDKPVNYRYEGYKLIPLHEVDDA
jgi:hypothetical protein